jgi:hypothetical protein
LFVDQRQVTAEWHRTKAEGQDPKMALALMRRLFGSRVAIRQRFPDDEASMSLHGASVETGRIP